MVIGRNFFRGFKREIFKMRKITEILWLFSENEEHSLFLRGLTSNPFLIEQISKN